MGQQPKAKALPNYLKPAIEVFKFPNFTKASDALKEALKIISAPGRWVTGAEMVGLSYSGPDFDPRQFIDADDFGVVACKTQARSKTAHAFCALGAVAFVNGPAKRSALSFLREAGKVVLKENDHFPGGGHNSIFRVNDDLGFIPTKKMFRLAIKAALKAGK